MEDKTLEIVERLARIETMLNTNIELLNSKATIQDVNALKEKVEDKSDRRETKSLDDRIAKLESNQTWIVRGFGAAIILAVMSSAGKFL